MLYRAYAIFQAMTTPKLLEIVNDYPDLVEKLNEYSRKGVEVYGVEIYVPRYG